MLSLPLELPGSRLLSNDALERPQLGDDRRGMRQALRDLEPLALDGGNDAADEAALADAPIAIRTAVGFRVGRALLLAAAYCHGNGVAALVAEHIDDGAPDA